MESVLYPKKKNLNRGKKGTGGKGPKSSTMPRGGGFCTQGGKHVLYSIHVELGRHSFNVFFFVLFSFSCLSN